MFTVPTTSGSTWASAVAAIGISCNTTSLFAGVIFTVAPNGRSEYIGKEIIGYVFVACLTAPFTNSLV